MSVKTLVSKIRKADLQFNLINDGDVIGIGLSGGKDSTLLLYLMSLYRHLAKNSLNKNFKLVGIHLDMNFGEEDMNPMFDFFKELDIEVVNVKTKIADILKLNKKNDKIQCSLCSKLKKGAVVKVAKENGCNKVAFGHHIDDALETLFLNAIYGGRLATFDTSMHLEDQDITFIRPFALVGEQEIKNLVASLKLPRLKSGCPNDGNTKRQDIKELLQSIYDQYPSSRKNFESMLCNSKAVSLYK